VKPDERHVELRASRKRMGTFDSAESGESPREDIDRKREEYKYNSQRISDSFRKSRRKRYDN
jgi:hypothetical protein